MKLNLFIIFTFACSLLKAQVSFKAIAPQEPVIAGESFRIQYVIEDGESITAFAPPQFRGFRLINGPEVYSGQSGTAATPRSLRNTIFTLQAMEPGHYFLQGAVAIINGKSSKSNDVLIQVITRAEAIKNRKPIDLPQDFEQTTYLAPGEDPYEKIRQNLFIKVMLDKNSCYPGEPVVATFKLYSRLQSKSDIVKNPGFYGFTVQDMVNLDDRIVNTETINGKSFDVHTVRKVQLYPLQAGKYVVDAMEIKNRVEFSRSTVNKKAEQEIIEGVFEDDDPTPLPGIEIFENNISTTPLSVTVKPLPSKGKPSDFNDATGSFSISSALAKDKLSRNEEGYLLVTVKGKGNFNQLVAPVINWPSGTEGFEPSITDLLDKSVKPLEGSRTFRYAFVASKPGSYLLPAISFSFFDPDSNKYKRIESSQQSFTVTNEEKKTLAVIQENKSSIDDVNKRVSWVAAGLVGLVVAFALLSIWFRDSRKKQAAPPQIIISEPTVEEILRPAVILIPAADKDFYSQLHRSIWQWINKSYGLHGATVAKHTVVAAMKDAGQTVEDINEFLYIISQCEAGMFTNASMDHDKIDLLERTRKWMQAAKK